MGPDRETVQFAVDNIDRQIRRFAPERYISLAGAVVAFGLTIYAAFKVIDSEVPDKETLAALCGANGVIAVALGFISRFFDKTFKLIDFLMRALVTAAPVGQPKAEADGEMKNG
jgi:hypothetical protein